MCEAQKYKTCENLQSGLYKIPFFTLVYNYNVHDLVQETEAVWKNK